jgi:hypothetical protein
MSTIVKPASVERPDSDIGKVLRQRRMDLEAELRGYSEQAEQFRLKAAEVQRQIVNLDAVLKDMGITVAPKKQPERTSRKPVPDEVKPGTAERPRAAADQEGTSAPPRSTKYERMKLTEAVKLMMSDQGNWTIDEVVDEVYSLATADQQQIAIAKANIRSVLATGVRNGLWERVSLGMYQLTKSGN